MEQTAFEQLIKYVIMAIIVTGSFGLASGLVIWSIKGYLNLRTKIPRAACAFVTLTDLNAHCDRRYDHCQEQHGALKNLMETKLDAAITALNERLKAGDKIFSDHRERLREIEKQLADKIQSLGSIREDLRIMLSDKQNSGSA